MNYVKTEGKCVFLCVCLSPCVHVSMCVSVCVCMRVCLFMCHPPTTVSSALSGAGPTLARPRPGPGGGQLGPGAPHGAHVAVFPAVTMATLPLHLRHHLVRRLVPGPHEGTVARDTQTGSHMRIQWPTESTALLLLIG